MIETENLLLEELRTKKLKIIEMINKVLNLWGINLAARAATASAPKRYS
jgi:hypothetical protein